MRPAHGPVTTLKTPADTLAMVPYLFGFEPAESLVVISLQGPRKRFGPCFRLDLVADPDDAAIAADYVLEIVRQHAFRSVLVIAFSERAESADPLVRRVLDGLDEVAVNVIDAFRADGHTWWSYVCDDPSCCDPLGAPYDVGSSRVSAEAVLAGLQKVPDRDALRDQFLPIGADRQEAVRASVERLDSSEHRVEPSALLAELTSLIDTCIRAPDGLAVDDLALLAWAVQDRRVRSRAWSMMSRSTAGEHFQLWRAVMRSVPDEMLAPVGGLTAFAAWLSGNGVLASHAADRVDEVCPGYSTVNLIRTALERAVDPRAWDAKRWSRLVDEADEAADAGDLGPDDAEEDDVM